MHKALEYHSRCTCRMDERRKNYTLSTSL